MRVCVRILLRLLGQEIFHTLPWSTLLKVRPSRRGAWEKSSNSLIMPGEWKVGGGAVTGHLAGLPNKSAEHLTDALKLLI